jgi:hypothetical protein
MVRMFLTFRSIFSLTWRKTSEPSGGGTMLLLYLRPAKPGQHRITAPHHCASYHHCGH